MNDQAKAWEAWLESDMGKKCVNRDTLGGAPYLHNRLWHAFMAGYKAASSPRRDTASIKP